MLCGVLRRYPTDSSTVYASRTWLLFTKRSGRFRLTLHLPVRCSSEHTFSLENCGSRLPKSLCSLRGVLSLPTGLPSQAFPVLDELFADSLRYRGGIHLPPPKLPSCP